MAILNKMITLDQAIRQSDFLKKNTFLWITNEDVFDTSCSKEFVFNSIVVMWGKHTDSYVCHISLNKVSPTSNVGPFMVGTNSNNGYFPNLEALRQSYPKLFKVKGDFQALSTRI